MYYALVVGSHAVPVHLRGRGEVGRGVGRGDVTTTAFIVKVDR